MGRWLGWGRWGRVVAGGGGLIWGFRVWVWGGGVGWWGEERKKMKVGKRGRR